MITSKQFCHDLLKDIMACKDPLDRIKIADGYAETLQAMLDEAKGQADVQQEPATV